MEPGSKEKKERNYAPFLTLLLVLVPAIASPVLGQNPLLSLPHWIFYQFAPNIFLVQKECNVIYG